MKRGRLEYYGLSKVLEVEIVTNASFSGVFH